MEQNLRNHFLNWLNANVEENKRAKTNAENDSGYESQSDIVYEDGNFKLIVEKGTFRRQKNFRLQDHLFYFKIEQKSETNPPLLLNILDFLHAAIVHILDSIKTFYAEDDRNTAYLTLYQVE